jgi:hypothetical protein
MSKKVKKGRPQDLKESPDRVGEGLTLAGLLVGFGVGRHQKSLAPYVGDEKRGAK